MKRNRTFAADIRVVCFFVMAAAAACALFFLLPNGQDELTDTADSLQAKPRSGRGMDYSAHEPRRGRDPYYAVEQRRVETFAFDPNTADSVELLRLGLAPYQVRGIYKYRAKGGVYHQKTDFSRVPGLTVRDYRRLEPYIEIGEEFRPAAGVIDRLSGLQLRDTVERPLKLDVGQTIDLNRADTAMLKRVPGVGSYFARAAIRYRDQLGGFVSPRQLAEIEGFPMSALAYMVASPDSIRRININKASLYEMRIHPYLRYYRAKRIVDFRRLYGKIKSIRQLLPTDEFDESDVERLAPYIEY